MDQNIIQIYWSRDILQSMSLCQLINQCNSMTIKNLQQNIKDIFGSGILWTRKQNILPQTTVAIKLYNMLQTGNNSLCHCSRCLEHQ